MKNDFPFKRIAKSAKSSSFRAYAMQQAQAHTAGIVIFEHSLFLRLSGKIGMFYIILKVFRKLRQVNIKTFNFI